MTSLRPARSSSAQRHRPDRLRQSGRPQQSGSPRSNRSHRPNPRPATRVNPDQAELRALDDALATAAASPAPAATTFAELGLSAPVVDVLRRAGIERPTDIQTLTLPDALAGRDVLGRAQTGSGKTLGFGLPMLTRLAADRQPRQPGRPRGLVLVPTRELANQVTDALRPVAGALNLNATTVVGGMPMGRQIDALKRGVDVLVATPGRLMDLMERRSVTLDAVEVAVLDEADHMADLGFLPAVTRILDATPAGRQCLLFSATLDRGVGKLVTRYLHDPAVHAAGSSSVPITEMDHRVFVLDHTAKVDVAAEIGARPGRSLFFVRTKHGADRLARQLTQRGVQSVAVHGNLNQNQRVRALDAFTSGRSRVLVATDVAARGLHIDDLDLVVHFDPPNDEKDYKHRSGRTARAGASGTVLSFVEPAQVRDVTKLHRAAGVMPVSTRVRSGDTAVREIAESGDVIDVVPETRPAVTNHPRPNRSGSRRPARRGPRRG